MLLRSVFTSRCPCLAPQPLSSCCCTRRSERTYSVIRLTGKPLRVERRVFGAMPRLGDDPNFATAYPNSLQTNLRGGVLRQCLSTAFWTLCLFLIVKKFFLTDYKVRSPLLSAIYYLYYCLYNINSIDSCNDRHLLEISITTCTRYDASTYRASITVSPTPCCCFWYFNTNTRTLLYMR